MNSFVQSGAVYRSQGFEGNVLSSSGWCSYILPKQAGGTPKNITFKTLRQIDSPAL